MHTLKVGEAKALKYTLYSTSRVGSCKAVLVLESDQKTIAFAPIIFEIKPYSFAGVSVSIPILYLILLLALIYAAYTLYSDLRAKTDEFGVFSWSYLRELRISTMATLSLAGLVLLYTLLAIFGIVPLF